VRVRVKVRTRVKDRYRIRVMARVWIRNSTGVRFNSNARTSTMVGGRARVKVMIRTISTSRAMTRIEFRVVL
jgi:hypothetical protein